MGMSPTELGVPPHLEALSCPGKPHPGRMSRQRWAEWRRQEGEGRILDSLGRGRSGGGGGVCWGRNREADKRGTGRSPLRGTAQVSPDRLDVSPSDLCLADNNSPD